MKLLCLILLLCAGCASTDGVKINSSTWTPVKVQAEPAPQYSHDPLIPVPR